MSKRLYEIRMPFTGVLYREIEAESEEEALSKFHYETTFPTMKATSETDGEIVEIEFHEKIIQGYVFYGVQNEYEIEDLGEVEE